MANARRFCISLALFTLAPAGLVHFARSEGSYRFLKEIRIGGEGGWDYLSIDAAARRLYVSHANKVVVIDLDNAAVAGEISDTPGVHGIALAPELNRGFTSNGQESKASIIDLQTLKTLSKVNTGENPDAILYDPGRQEVYTFNGRGQSATVFEAKSGKLVDTVPLPGKPEFAVVDTRVKRVYANIEDKNSVVVIDTETHKIAVTWPIAPGESASGMAIDFKNHRLFVGCENKLMVMMDSENGRVVSTVPIGQGVDANAFDPSTGLVTKIEQSNGVSFSSNGDGTVTIAREETPEKLAVVQTLTTMRGARTMALDPKTHNLYLAAAEYEPALPTVPGAPRPRPKIVPGTFRVLVYGIGK